MKNTTLILHSVREKSKLTLSEYVVLDFLDGLKENSLPLNEAMCNSCIAVDLNVVKIICEELKTKGFLEVAEPKKPFLYNTTDKWKSLFELTSKEVVALMQPISVNNKRMTWGPSSIKKTEQLMKVLIKKTAFEDILDGKIRYFCYLAFLDWERQPMASEVFIGPKQSFGTSWWLDTDEFYLAYKKISKELNPKIDTELSRSKYARNKVVEYKNEEKSYEEILPEEDQVPTYKKLFQ